jgi:hypothetical protein
MLSITAPIWATVCAHVAAIAFLLVPVALWLRRRRDAPWLYAIGVATLACAVFMFVVTLAITFLFPSPNPVSGRSWPGLFLVSHSLAAIFGAFAVIFGAWARVQRMRAELAALAKARETARRKIADGGAPPSSPE